jgi:hypothetical protein
MVRTGSYDEDLNGTEFKVTCCEKVPDRPGAAANGVVCPQLTGAATLRAQFTLYRRGLA